MTIQQKAASMLMRVQATANHQKLNQLNNKKYLKMLKVTEDVKQSLQISVDERTRLTSTTLDELEKELTDVAKVALAQLQQHMTDQLSSHTAGINTCFQAMVCASTFKLPLCKQAHTVL